jgi:hypothetical protein
VSSRTPHLTWNFSRFDPLPTCGLSRYFAACKYSDCGLELLFGVYVMLAQEAWRTWPRRLGALGVVTHPISDLEYFLVQGAPSTPLDIFRPSNILTAASNYCSGPYVMLAQEVLRAWPHRLGAIVVITYPVPDLEYFLVQPSPPLLTILIFCGL